MRKVGGVYQRGVAAYLPSLMPKTGVNYGANLILLIADVCRFGFLVLSQSKDAPDLLRNKCLPINLANFTPAYFGLRQAYEMYVLVNSPYVFFFGRLVLYLSQVKYTGMH